MLGKVIDDILNAGSKTFFGVPAEPLFRIKTIEERARGMFNPEAWIKYVSQLPPTGPRRP